MKKYSLYIFGVLALSEIAMHACSITFFSGMIDVDTTIPTSPRTTQQQYVAPVYIALIAHQPSPTLPSHNTPSSGSC